MVGRQSPTALRRWISQELKRLRTAAGKEPAEVAERLGKTPGAYRHFENNVRTPSPSDIEVLLNWYGRPERVPFFRNLLVAAGKGKDWWINFPAVPDWFELYLGLESNAAVISSYDQVVVPGLFQTPDYARALYRAGQRNLDEGQVLAAVELRMARQEILTRPDNPPQVRSVLDESALRRLVGGPETTRGQLGHLVELARLPNLDLRVLPYSAGGHPGIEGTFTILDYDDEFGDDPGTAYVETRAQGLYYEERAQVADYRAVFDRLLELAEPREKTIDLIRKAATLL
ncbi:MULTISPECIES: helix-turn-helix transcriptional regulator [Actinosynnema]|uniref:helix-turn-helix domain-containing protein n=1 Tax=Actinosynnema TaxID=40566 RepID=UPI0020A2607F|nr:helix-turn-helix transcriptional regulator [Actinosynnema pretiosum]MCP2097392.1 Helix-turn-helix domain-containing protein [Actinosynnema pretiosum]